MHNRLQNAYRIHQCKIHAAAAFLMIFIPAAAPMDAAAQISIGVAPLRAEHAIQAGQLKTDIITINNLSSKPQRMQASVSDWYLPADGIPVFVKRGKAPDFSMSEWTELNPTEFEIPAGGSQILRYTIEVPPGTPEGGYRTSILIESIPHYSAMKQPAAYNINARIGVMIYNRVGDAPIFPEVAGQHIILSPDAPSKTAVELSIKNNGRVHFRIRGKCTIENLHGSVIEVLDITDSVVLPQSARNIILPVSTKLPNDGFRILSRVDAGVPEILEVETVVTSQNASN